MTSTYWRRCLLAVFALLAGGSYALPQESRYAPPFPREGAKLVQDNERVAIWDVTQVRGQSMSMTQLPFDQVSVRLADAAVKVTRPDGSWQIEQQRLGSIRVDSKGSIFTEQVVGETPARSIVVLLKGGSTPKIDAAPAGKAPPQFPRPGSTKLFDSDHFIVWDHVWRPGEPKRFHIHTTQVVGVFIEPGTIRSSPSEGTPRETARSLGDVTFSSLMNSPHAEETIQGTPRAIFIELK